MQVGAVRYFICHCNLTRVAALLVSQVQEVVASSAEFLYKSSNIKGLWQHGSWLTQRSRLAMSSRRSRTRVITTLRRNIFVQEATFASFSGESCNFTHLICK